MRLDENLTRFNSLFAGDGPNRLFVYFQAIDRAEEVSVFDLAYTFLLGSAGQISTPGRFAMRFCTSE